jgi:hypothetical protein
MMMTQSAAIDVLQSHDWFGGVAPRLLRTAVEVLSPVVDGREHNRTDASLDWITDLVRSVSDYL